MVSHLSPAPRTQSATKTFDFQSVQTLRTKLAESVDVPVERENQLLSQENDEARVRKGGHKVNFSKGK